MKKDRHGKAEKETVRQLRARRKKGDGDFHPYEAAQNRKKRNMEDQKMKKRTREDGNCGGLKEGKKRAILTKKTSFFGRN